MDIQEFLKQFELKGDGTGFWDSYDGKTSWLGNNVRISIAARSVSEEIVSLYQKIMSEQEKFDILWKEFVVNELIVEMQIESDDKSISKQQLLQELKVATLTFGFDEDGLVSVWFHKPKPFLEHTILLYGDRGGNPSVAVMEG